MDELHPLRQNLQNNLWKLIDGKSIEQFHFMEYLLDILIKRSINIPLIPLGIFKNYGEQLKKKYINTLEYLSINIKHGEIFKLEKYVKNKVNGEFSKIINQFVFEFEKGTNKYIN